MAKLTPEFADRVRQICTDVLPMQITRRESNQSFYDYVRLEQPLTDEEVIGISCGQRQGYLNSMCVVDERGIDCSRIETVFDIPTRSGRLLRRLFNDF